jgi:hypothetical protein
MGGKILLKFITTKNSIDVIERQSECETVELNNFS